MADTLIAVGFGAILSFAITVLASYLQRHWQREDAWRERSAAAWKELQSGVLEVQRLGISIRFRFLQQELAGGVKSRPTSEGIEENNAFVAQLSQVIALSSHLPNDAMRAARKNLWQAAAEGVTGDGVDAETKWDAALELINTISDECSKEIRAIYEQPRFLPRIRPSDTRQGDTP